MIINNYIIEIKNRFILSFLSWLCCLIINLNYQDNLIYILLKPCLKSYIENPFYFVYNNLSEPLYTNIQTSINFSNQIFFLFLVYHFLKFLSPGLYKNEYNKIKFIIKTGVLMFCVSLFILYKALIPYSWKFFINYQHNQTIEFFFEANFKEYIELIYVSYKIIILLTLITLILIYLIYTNKNLHKFLINYRKIIYFIIVIISSCITPPDILSQIILSLCFITGFEFIIYNFLQLKFLR